MGLDDRFCLKIHVSFDQSSQSNLESNRPNKCFVGAIDNVQVQIIAVQWVRTGLCL